MMRAPRAAALALILILALLLPLPTRAGEKAPVLSLEAAVAEALQTNPEVQAAEHAWRAAAHVPRQVSGLEDPTVSYEAWNTPNAFTFDRAESSIYTVGQKIPFPGKLGLRGKAARLSAQAEEQRFAQKRLEVAAKVTAAYADLFQAERNLEIVRRYRELARALADSARARYEAGEAAQPDVIKADLGRTRLETDLNDLEETRRGALARLNALLDRPQAGDARVATDLPVKPIAAAVETLERAAALRRPAVRAASLEVDRAETERRLARRRYFPDFEVRGSRWINEGADNGYGAMLVVNVPWVWRGKHDAANAEARERARAARALLRSEKNVAAGGVRELYARADRARRNAEIVRTALLPQARLAFESSLAGYGVGENDFPSVLDSFESLLYLETQAAEEVAAFVRTRAGLEEMVGEPIP